MLRKPMGWRISRLAHVVDPAQYRCGEDPTVYAHVVRALPAKLRRGVEPLWRRLEALDAETTKVTAALRRKLKVSGPPAPFPDEEATT
jgi:hypothetical protein